MDLLILWLVCAFICAAIASSKGRSTGGWFVLGLIFGIFAVIVVAVLSNLKRPVIVAGLEAATPETHVRCPECRELVRKDAKRCKHCLITLVPDEE